MVFFIDNTTYKGWGHSLINIFLSLGFFEVFFGGLHLGNQQRLKEGSYYFPFTNIIIIL